MGKIAYLLVFLAVAAVASLCLAYVFHLTMQAFFTFRWPLSNWIIIALGCVLAATILHDIAPRLIAPLSVSIQTGIGLIAASLFIDIPLTGHTLALCVGGIFFFLLVVMMADRPSRPALPDPPADPFGSGVDDPDIARLKKEGIID